MDLTLKGKTALITGSSKGIGFSIARTLHDEGCNIILNSRHGKDLKMASKKFERVSSFAADVTKPLECDRLVKHIIKTWGNLDILICNVGSGASVSPGNETDAEWKKMFEMNFFSATNIINACRGLLKKSKGNITCISSIVGIETLGAPLTYSSSKAALNNFVRGVSIPFADDGIRINSVAPGNIFFKGSVWDRKIKENPKKIKKMLVDNVPLKRFGKPEEIADFVTYLSSSKSNFITGGIFVIDGGQLKS